MGGGRIGGKSKENSEGEGQRGAEGSLDKTGQAGMARLSVPHLFVPLVLLTGEGEEPLGFWWEWMLCGLFRIGTIMVRIIWEFGSEVNTDTIFHVRSYFYIPKWQRLELPRA